MPVVFLLNVGHFVLVVAALCVFLAVPLVRFSPFCYLAFAFFNHCASGSKAGGRNNVLSLAFHWVSDGLDATLLHFFSEHKMLLMLRCYISS